MVRVAFASACIAWVGFTGAAVATTISVDAAGNPWEVFHYRGSSGPNSVGFARSDSLIFGAVNVVPNGKGEDNGTVVSPNFTTGTARQNGTEVDLNFFPNNITPNEFANGVAYDPTLTGAWEFTFTNGTDQLVVHTPEVGATQVIDRITNVRITGGADTTTPSFAWDLVPGVDAYKISIYDLTQRNPQGFANRIFVSDPDDGNSTFTIPDGVLDPEGLYAIEFQTSLLRNSGTNPSGSSQAGAAISINRTFFDFTLVDLPVEGDLFLPEVDYATGTPRFNFDNPVLANQIQYYDPLVAVGYDYLIGEGNPNFSSFILPMIGDGLFELWTFDDVISDYLFENFVAAQSLYTFGERGVDRFRILGIETSAGLNPNDPTAFVTGLSFVSDGRFSGSMIPITQEIAAVPLPASLSLLVGACAMLGVGRGLVRLRSA